MRVAGSRQINQNGTWVDAPIQAATIQKLEEEGLTSPESIRSLSSDQIKELKLDKKRVAAIQSYLRRI